MLTGKNIVLGVTGGIAAYKSCDLVSRLRKLNANVDVIMTDAAMEFVNPLTFQVMSNNKVHYDMFQELSSVDVEHISLAKKADIILIAPATANTISKIANGICDNLLTTVVSANRSRVVFAPAMNTKMYENVIFQENMNKLKALGYEFIDSAEGLLACGDTGIGKMAETIDIIEYILDSFEEKDLKGLKFTITAGPTREPIDPVRYISNKSSGKMGYSIAKRVLDRGGSVNLITGPTSLNYPKGAKIYPVTTTVEMMEALEEVFEETDILVKSAAPSDFKPKNFTDQKIKKTDEDNEMTIDLVENPDIVRHFGNKKRDDQLIIGFAAETQNLRENAISKLSKKNLDMIVANDVSKKGAGFDGDTNIITIIENNGDITDYPIMSKLEVADTILDKIKDLFL